MDKIIHVLGDNLEYFFKLILDHYGNPREVNRVLTIKVFKLLLLLIMIFFFLKE